MGPYGYLAEAAESFVVLATKPRKAPEALWVSQAGCAVEAADKSRRRS